MGDIYFCCVLQKRYIYIVCGLQHLPLCINIISNNVYCASLQILTSLFFYDTIEIFPCADFWLKMRAVMSQDPLKLCLLFGRSVWTIKGTNKIRRLFLFHDTILCHKHFRCLLGNGGCGHRAMVCLHLGCWVFICRYKQITKYLYENNFR